MEEYTKLRNFWKNKKVFITGHTGFKGSWMCLMLNLFGAQIYGYSLKPEKKSLFNQSHCSKFLKKNIFSNIKNKKKLSQSINKIRPEVLFHLAAQPLVLEGYKNPIETFDTNIIGTINVLNAMRSCKSLKSAVIITTDKVYKNRNVEFGYRESDELGGNDPYSASKAACELAVYSWRKSFCESDNKLNKLLSIATARSGNVIGGGDWSIDRIVPDTIKAFKDEKILKIRNSRHTRPWQHVLDPLSGYMMLAMHNFISENSYNEAFNFGPKIESNTPVIRLVEEIIKHWPGKFSEEAQKDSFYEAELLNLKIDKSFNLLNWYPKWGFEESVQRTVKWYKDFYENNSAYECMLNDIKTFFKI